MRRKLAIFISVGMCIILTACGRTKEETTEEKETATLTVTTTESMEEYELVTSGNGDGNVTPFDEPTPSEKDLQRSGRRIIEGEGSSIQVANLNLIDEELKDEELIFAAKEYKDRMNSDKTIISISFTERTEKGYVAWVRFSGGGESQMEFRKKDDVWKLFMYSPGVELDDYGVPVDKNLPIGQS